MTNIRVLFRPWRGGCRQLTREDYVTAFSLPLLIILVECREALFLGTTKSLTALICMVYTCYLIHSKNCWPRSPSARVVLAVLASVLSVAVTFSPGPRSNAWIMAVLVLCALNFYHFLLELAWQEFRESFTPGELLIHAQTAVIYFFTALVEALKIDRSVVKSQLTDNSQSPVAAVGRTAVLASVLVFILTVQNPPFFYPILGSILTCGCVYLWIMLHQNPVMWLIDFLSHSSRIYMISYWSLVLTTCLPVLFYYRTHSHESYPSGTHSHESCQSGTHSHESCQSSCNGSSRSRDRNGGRSDWSSASRDGPTTITRKFFHLVIVAIYLPALFLDVPLLYLASAVALAGLILIETMRLLNIPPLGGLVSNLFSSFKDQQDRGKLILTPIYLLVGCTIPVWLYGGKIQSGEAPPLIVFIGLMSVGVGDAFAAIVGSKLGKHTYQFVEGRKSLAGLLAALTSQTLFWLLLLHFGVVGDHWMPLVIMVSSLTETLTDQLDNLVITIYSTLAYVLLGQFAEQTIGLMNPTEL